jgi:hypothetical protein
MDLCAICLDILINNDYCITKCKHKFCIDCITKIVDLSNKCPYCRSIIIVGKYKKRVLKSSQTLGPFGILQDKWLLIDKIILKQKPFYIKFYDFCFNIFEFSINICNNIIYSIINVIYFIYILYLLIKFIIKFKKIMININYTLILKLIIIFGNIIYIMYFIDRLNRINVNRLNQIIN